MKIIVVVEYYVIHDYNKSEEIQLNYECFIDFSNVCCPLGLRRPHRTKWCNRDKLSRHTAFQHISDFECLKCEVNQFCRVDNNTTKQAAQFDHLDHV